jgi:hypothetical protein
MDHGLLLLRIQMVQTDHGYSSQADDGAF